MKSREQSPDEQRQKVHEANVEYLVRDKLLRQKIQYDLKSTYAEQVRLKKEMEHFDKKKEIEEENRRINNAIKSIEYEKDYRNHTK